MVNKECIVWGCGEFGKYIQEYIKEEGYKIIAYCDTFKNGKMGEIDIIDIDKAIEICTNNKQIEIIVGILDTDINSEIQELILEKFPKETIYRLGTDILDSVQRRELERYHKKMQYKWDVSLSTEYAEWIDNIDSEVTFWIKSVAHKDGVFHEAYIKRRENEMFGHEILKDIVKEGDIVLDIGCGLISMYGNRLENGSKIKLLPVDALAHFYNRINDSINDGRKQGYECQFGMFEFTGQIFGENYADAIIINNALDHSIDPFRSLLECLYALKVNGTLCMRHKRAEALNELWTGLHRWNVDCINGALILWNKDNAVNVSQVLRDYVDIDVTCDDTINREEQSVYVRAVKRKRFDINKFVDTKNEIGVLLDCIDVSMRHLARGERNFLNMLENSHF